MRNSPVFSLRIIDCLHSSIRCARRSRCFPPAYLPQQRKIRASRSSILLKLLSKPSSQQPIFNPHSNLRSHKKHQSRDHEQRRRSRHESDPPKHAKHRRVDRMAHQPIRPTLHQVMLCANRRIEPKMFSPQSSRSRPRQRNRKHEAQQRSHHSPKLRRHSPETALQHQRIAHQLQRQTPARPPINTLRRTSAPSSPHKRSQPKD